MSGGCAIWYLFEESKIYRKERFSINRQPLVVLYFGLGVMVTLKMIDLLVALLIAGIVGSFLRFRTVK